MVSIINEAFLLALETLRRIDATNSRSFMSGKRVAQDQLIPLAFGQGLGFGSLADGADGKTSPFEKRRDAFERLVIKGHGEDCFFFPHLINRSLCK